MRFPQAIIIDPRRVLPSRHSIFIRGFSGSVNIEDVKELFSKQCDGKCRIDFFSYSDDKAQLFVAIRFDSHAVAKRLISKYDGERIFGYKVELNWFKDIRKARKKALRRMGIKRFGGKIMPRHFDQPPIRQCVSSSNSSGASSRSSSFSRQSRRGRRRNRSSHRRGSSSSCSSRSPPRPTPAKRVVRAPIRSSQSRSASYSSSSSSNASCEPGVNGHKESTPIQSTPLAYQYDERSGEKEVLQVALESCSPPVKGRTSGTHSSSSGSPQAASQSNQGFGQFSEPIPQQKVHQKVVQPEPQQQQQEISIASNSESAKDDRSPKRKRDKRRKYARHRRTKQQRRTQSPEPVQSSDSPSSERIAMDVTKPIENPLENETLHPVPQVEEVTLNTIFLPDEQPELQCERKSDTANSHPPTPLSATHVDSPQLEPIAENSNSSDSQLKQNTPSNSKEQDQIRTQTPPASQSLKESSTDFGIQASISTAGTAPISAPEDILSQISFLTDTKVDEIFQQKRLIEAAYRLDCESYTVSIGKLIRLNPDLRDRLLISLRTLLEERARQSINELQEYIRKLRR